MEDHIGLLLLLVLLVFVLNQLASIARSLQNCEAMMRRFLAHEGVDWQVPVEPSNRVRELASNPRDRVAAIKAYREQTGLGLREAKAVIDELSRPRRNAA